MKNPVSKFAFTFNLYRYTTVIRLAGMPTTKGNEQALGSKTHVIFATGDQKAPDERFTPKVTPTDASLPPNALSAAAPHFNPDLLWILEDQKSTLGGAASQAGACS